MILENRIQISAPIATVWCVMEDVENWPDWTPTIKSLKRLDEGPFQVGSQALIKQPGLPEAEWRVTALERGKVFTWETQVPGLWMRATHELTPAGESAENLLRIEMSGILVWLFWPLVRISVGKALAKENRGLKMKCEQQAESN